MQLDAFNCQLVKENNDPPAPHFKKIRLIGGPYDWTTYWQDPAYQMLPFFFGTGLDVKTTKQPEEIVHIYRRFGDRMYYQRYCRRDQLESLLVEEERWVLPTI